MKLRFIAPLVIVSLILQSCAQTIYTMNNREGGQRYPAAIELNPLPLAVELLKDKFEKFNQLIYGINAEPKNREDGKKVYDDLMRRIQGNAICSLTPFEIDTSEIQSRVKQEKKIGAFDQSIKMIMNAHAQNISLKNYAEDQELMNLLNQAVLIKKDVQQLLLNKSNDPTLLAFAINEYHTNVLLPLREMFLIRRAYVPEPHKMNFYLDSLLVEIPASLVKNFSSDEIGLMTIGDRPSDRPHYLELVENSDGKNHKIKFSENNIVRSDFLTLLKAPTPKNYVTVLRWMTAHMMLGQLTIYNLLNGIKGDVELPKSCYTQFNGELPAHFKVSFNEGDGEKYLENILANNGLLMKENSSEYFDYYVENVNKNPLEDGYSGILPFENYSLAKRGMSSNERGALQVEFDDVAHFENVMNVLIPEALFKFRGEEESSSLMGVTKYKVKYPGLDLLNSILQEVPRDQVDVIAGKEIYAGKQNLSDYLLNVMREKKVTDYTDLITPNIKEALSSEVLIDFPSLYSISYWRDWSLKTIADIFYKYRDLPTNSSLHRMVDEACLSAMTESHDQTLCRKPGNKVQMFSDLLQEFRTVKDEYLPIKKLEEANLREVYPVLKKVWLGLRAKTDLLPEASPTEYEYLIKQMGAYNPWARMRLSYLVAISELEKKSSSNNCDEKIIQGQLGRLKKAGAVLGLNRPLNNKMAESLLSSAQKKNLWQEIVNQTNSKSAQIFNVTSAGREYFKLMENISYKTLLNQPDAEKTFSQTKLQSSDQLKKELLGATGRVEQKLSEFFYKLYKLKGQPEKQKEIFTEFSKVNGIDSSYNVKIGFLKTDEVFKQALYNEIIRQGAMVRKRQIESALNHFCTIDPNDHSGLKEIFYSTTKIQLEINKLAGLPDIPKDVSEQVNKMSPSEKSDMWWGIGSGVMGMGAILLGSACTVVTEGLCAPLGVTMAATGAASMGIQTKLVQNEVVRKLNNDDEENNIKKMEELGFANEGTAQSYHRSYVWSVVNAVGIIPMIGITSKTIQLGSKLSYLSSKELMKSSGKSAFKAIVRKTLEEDEVRQSRYILDFESFAKNATTSVNVAEEGEKLKVLYLSGKISDAELLQKLATIFEPVTLKGVLKRIARAEVGEVAVLESKEEIDRNAAKVLGQYFRGNVKDMKRFVSQYTGGRLKRAVQVMEEFKTGKRIGKGLPIYRNVRDWYAKMRNEDLALNADKFYRLEKELNELPKTEGALESYLYKNMDLVTDVFLKIPMKKRELAYMFSFQGMPYIGGTRIPILSLFSEGQIVKKIVSARARLINESFLAKARIKLGINPNVAAHTAQETFENFQKAIAVYASSLDPQKSEAVLKEYLNLEETLALRIYNEVDVKKMKIPFDAFRSALFNPRNIEESAYARAYWEATKPDEILRMKEVSSLSHKAVEELSNYSDVDSFENYLSALKVLIINREKAVVNF